MRYDEKGKNSGPANRKQDGSTTIKPSMSPLASVFAHNLGKLEQWFILFVGMLPWAQHDSSAV